MLGPVMLCLAVYTLPCNQPPRQLFLDAGSPPYTLSEMKILCYHRTKSYFVSF
uniref:(California timema) hypothetical protein n=1 Tax=Timema californicum TaxID=61474 RepID=A0A7R9JLZ8_TIMCA|nr:unnamed protein product [Timema californicum]